MELPLPRPFGTEGGGGGGEGRKPTHDFLSLYSHSTIPQDPKPPSQSGHIKTHDFLRPLERVGKTTAKEETNEISVVEKSPIAPPTSVEHILPGGIGTYSISHISYFNNQAVPEPEGTMSTVAQASSTDDNKNDRSSNCSSYTAGSGFTLWEESALKKGETGKENVGERSNAVREVAATTGWGASDRQSPLSSNNHRNSFSSLSSSSLLSGLKNQSFMEIIKSAKDGTQDNDMDDEEEIVLKNESSSPVHKAIGDLRIKVDRKSNDQKANTPRSKHSATEQRRRSKINDRFQTLRELIPHGDQKRDKASFLSEVIEYIQFLQEKVQKYEGSYQGWNQDPAKLETWKNNSRPGESYIDHYGGINNSIGPGLLFSGTLDDKTITVSPIIPGNAKNPVESDMSSATTFKPMDQHLGITNTAMSFPMSLPPNFFHPDRTVGAVAQFAHRMTSDAENMANQPLAQSHLTRLGATDALLANDKLKEEDLTIEAGTISISSVYSQGLLNTLTQVLHSSGVDLSQASISVQIELGKQASGMPVAQRSILKDNEVPSGNRKATPSRNSSGEGSDPALKKLKTITS